MKKCKSMKKILLILIVGVSCMSVFGQSDAKIPMFITGIKNQTLELHTSCVKRPTDVGVVVSGYQSAAPPYGCAPAIH